MGVCAQVLAYAAVTSAALWFLLRLMPKPKNIHAHGIRNNNPLNIKYYSGTDWLGSEPHRMGQKFVVFKSPEYGIRAATKILLSYRERDIITVSEIIKRWAPESENDTKSYINFISKATKLEKNQEVRIDDYENLIDNMIFFENGLQPYSQAILKKGILLA